MSAAGSERLGWWLVDPFTGRVVDQAEDGRAVSVTSDLVVKAIVAIGVGGLRAWTVTAAVKSFNTIHYEKATNTLQARLTF